MLYLCKMATVFAVIPTVCTGARVRAGLNKSILSRAWGQIRQHISPKASPKAFEAGMLATGITAHCTSQACCKCGYSENADFNADKNIRNKGAKHFLCRHSCEKAKKNVMRAPQKIPAADCPEVTLREKQISRSAGGGMTHAWVNQDPHLWPVCEGGWRRHGRLSLHCVSLKCFEPISKS